MNEIYVRNVIIDYYKDGKSREEIVDFFYNNNGVFLWGYVERDKIRIKVDNVIDDYNNPKYKADKFPFIMLGLLVILLILCFI